MGLICPICEEQGKKSMVKFIGHLEEDRLWDYDEEGNVVERKVQVMIECSRGHKTSAELRGVLDKAKQV